jgi:hypothetical protein
MLEAFVTEKAGGKLDPRFRGIAGLYKEHGGATGVRWDYAFFQMIVETNALSFKAARGRNSELSADLNNFASIAKPGNNEGLERFKDVSQGVLAHLHHVRLYSGDPVDKPVARRTREVRSFIQPWAKTLGRPVTFTDLAERWAPQDKEYSDRIEEMAQDFRAKHCSGLRSDPSVAARQKPEIVAKVEEAEEEQPEAKRPSRSKKAQRHQRRKGRDSEESETSNEVKRPPVLSAEVKQATKADDEDETPEEMEAKANARKKSEPASKSQPPEKRPPVEASPTKTASVTPAVTPKAPEPPVSKDKINCRVWTASFGGDRAILLKVVENGLASYTALEVSSKDAEAQTLAFISAYAKGGIKIGEYTSREDALARAFELCPQG